MNLITGSDRLLLFPLYSEETGSFIGNLIPLGKSQCQGQNVVLFNDGSVNKHD